MLFEVKIPFHVSLLTRTPVCETGLDREPTNSNSFLNFLIVFIDVGCCVKIFSKALKSNTTLFARIFTGKPVSVFHFILIALCSLWFTSFVHASEASLFAIVIVNKTVWINPIYCNQIVGNACLLITSPTRKLNATRVDERQVNMKKNMLFFFPLCFLQSSTQNVSY